MEIHVLSRSSRARRRAIGYFFTHSESFYPSAFIVYPLVEVRAAVDVEQLPGHKIAVR
jgi:hypothetical protein